MIDNAQDKSEELRLHSLLALLRMEEPKCAIYLNDSSETIQYAAARGISRHNIEAAIPALAVYADTHEVR